MASTGQEGTVGGIKASLRLYESGIGLLNESGATVRVSAVGTSAAGANVAAGPVEERELTILEEAEKLTSGDRNRDYGHPLDNFEAIAAMWSVIADKGITAEQVCLMMVAVKICRNLHKGKRDNLVDGAGYFRLIERMQEERARRMKLSPQ